MLDTPPPDKSELVEHASLSTVTHLHIEMGYQCNYRCTFCYQVDFSAKQNLDEVVWRERLRPLYPTLKSTFLQGGEPTVMKNCIGYRDMMMKEYPQVKLGVVSNGYRFDEVWCDALVNQGYLVQFSLNGATKRVYDRTMKFGHHDVVMQNIKRLVDRRAEAKANGLRLAISCVIVPENTCELADFISLGSDLGFSEVKFFTDTVLSPASEDTEGTLREIDRAYEAMKKHPEINVSGLESFEFMYRTRHGLLEQNSEAAKRCDCVRAQSMCPLPWTQVYVKHKGEVTYCCMTWRDVGNLHKEPLEKIWNSPKAREFRRLMLRGNYKYCSPSCLSNPKPDYSAWFVARKFAGQVSQDPDLVWKKAKNKITKYRTYRKDNRKVHDEYPSVQPEKKSKEKIAEPQS